LQELASGVRSKIPLLAARTSSAKRINFNDMSIYNTVDLQVRLKILTSDFTVKLTSVVNELEYSFATRTAGAVLEDAEIISCEIVARETPRG
jgi:hypothetical protein